MANFFKKLCQSHPCTNITTLTLTIRLAQWSKPQKKHFDYKSRIHKFKHELKYNKTWANNMKKKKEVRQCIQNKEV